MLVTQLDGLCVQMANISPENKYLAVDGKVHTSFFMKDLNGDMVIPFINDDAKLYTDSDNVNDLRVFINT